MKRRMNNVFWGILLILCAVILVLSQLGLLGGIRISIWKVFISLILIAIAVKSLFVRSFAGIFFPAAFLCILFDEVLGITALTPWTVLLVALLLSIAFSMIFKGRFGTGWFGCEAGRHGWQHFDGEEYSNIVDEQDGEVVRSSSSFSGTIKYVNSDHFKKAYVTNRFGSTKIYFDNAVIQGDEAEIRVENSFGEIELFLPKEWQVINKVNCAFAGVEEKNSKPAGVENRKVYLTGSISFGAVTILYV